MKTAVALYHSDQVHRNEPKTGTKQRAMVTDTLEDQQQEKPKRKRSSQNSQSSSSHSRQSTRIEKKAKSGSAHQVGHPQDSFLQALARYRMGTHPQEKTRRTSLLQVQESTVLEGQRSRLLASFSLNISQKDVQSRKQTVPPRSPCRKTKGTREVNASKAKPFMKSTGRMCIVDRGASLHMMGVHFPTSAGKGIPPDKRNSDQ